MNSDRFQQAFCYGCDYHPEQWDVSTWNDDVHHMVDLGINLVTLGSDTWPINHPSPDVYNLEWLGHIIPQLHESRIAVCLSTGTAKIPAWLAHRHPEILRQNANGSRGDIFTSRNFCPNNPVYRELAAQQASILGSTFGEHPAMALWRIDNGCFDSIPTCHCSLCLAEFQHWLENKYGSLDALQEAWGTRFCGRLFTAWTDIQLPAQPDCTPHLTLDYKRFMSDSYMGCMLNEMAALRKVSTRLMIATSMASHLGSIKSVNLFDWAQSVDCMICDATDPLRSNDPATNAFLMDLHKSLAPDRPWILQIQPPRQLGNEATNISTRRGWLHNTASQAVARGARGIFIGHWKAAPSGMRKFHGAMVPHGGTNTVAFEDFKQLGQSLALLGPGNLAQSQAQVGLILDWESVWAMEQDIHVPLSDLASWHQAYHRPLYRTNIPVDIIRPETNLSQYKLVIAPALYMLRDGVVESIRDYVTRGGTFVAGLFSGIVDKHSHLFPNGFPGTLQSILGIRVEEIQALNPSSQHRLTLRNKELYPKYSHWTSMIRLDGAEATAQFADGPYSGNPAITTNACGSGLACFIGTQVDSDFLKSFLTEICEENGIQSLIKVPPGIEVALRSNVLGHFLFLINHQNEAQFIELGTWEGIDLLTGAPLGEHAPVPATASCVLHIENEQNTYSLVDEVNVAIQNTETDTV